MGAGAYTLALCSEYGKSRSKANEPASWGYFTDFVLGDVFVQPPHRPNSRISIGNHALTDGQKAVITIVGANALVFLLWRIPQLRSQMFRYFTNSFASSISFEVLFINQYIIIESLCAPMVLSVFSHNNLIHLLVNMYVLHSFTSVSVDRFMGIDQVGRFHHLSMCSLLICSSSPSFSRQACSHLSPAWCTNA